MSIANHTIEKVRDAYKAVFNTRLMLEDFQDGSPALRLHRVASVRLR